MLMPSGKKLAEHAIFADTSKLDGKALSQFYDAIKVEGVVKGALMPDAHAGYSLPIGAVVATDGLVFPSWVGYDIGCGVCAIETPFVEEDLKLLRKEIFDEIYKTIPVGFNIRTKRHDSMDEGTVDWFWDNWLTPLDRPSYITDDLRKVWKDKNADRALGTLGGGNHFIELGVNKHDDRVWIIVHSGSRGFGHGLATHYMKLAANGKASEGNFGFSMNSQEGLDYYNDVSFTLMYALRNRAIMIDDVIWKLCQATNTMYKSSDWEGTFVNRNHNHVEYNSVHCVYIHRKGATHAEAEMLGIIPGNMRDGCYLVKGKGNWDSLYSSSHGAGRLLGRRVAKETLDYDKFVNEMSAADIVARTDKGVLDESPDAYKNFDEVMEHQEELIDVLTHFRTILNVKG